MRYLTGLFFVGVLFTSCWSRAQTYDAKISGSIVANSLEVIPGVITTLYKGFDSITSTKTDHEGLFLMEVALLDQTDYILRIENKKGVRINDELKFQTEMYRSDFVFELAYPHSTTCNLSNNLIAHYVANETRKMENFEVEMLIHLLKEHPKICIEFSQVIIRSESDKTAKKRMSNFKNYLEEYGVDMSCVRFDETVHYLNAFHEDQRSRIEGVVHSLESTCH